MISPLALLAVLLFASAAVGQEKRIAVGEGPMDPCRRRVGTDPGFRGKGWILTRVMIRYKPKREEAEREPELLRVVYEEIESVQPDDLRYASFRLEDGVSFVSFVETGGGPGPLPRLEVFRRYRAALDARCEETPVMTEPHGVGSYRFP